MGFAFKWKNSPASHVRAIASEQVEKALVAVDTVEDFDATVHQLRRRCKKLRGLLRLVKPHLKQFQEENAAVRDAADLLGGARDALVLVETLDSLVSHSSGHAAAAQAIAVRQLLVERAERHAGQADQAASLQRFGEIFGKLGSRIGHWRIDGRGFSVIGDGLEQTYRDFRTGAAAAEKQETSEALHEWRKQAKYHGHHVSLLSRAASDILRPRGKSLDRLGDILGDHHNLAMLGKALEKAALGDIALLEQAIAERQNELAQSAIMLGRQLAAEKPAALRDRFAAYWQLLPEEN